MRTRQPRSVYDARWKARHPNYIPPPQDPIKRQAYYQNNKEYILAKSSHRYHNMTLEQREEHNQKRRERHAKQPEVRNRIERIRDHNLRASGTITSQEWQQVCQNFRNKCIYCSSSNKITLEHLTPISRGGTNDLDNLAPACLSCNSSKRNKTYTEYIIWRAKQRVEVI